jgi:hypothetical protein
MAYLQARSGIARSGVTYCGWTPPSVKAYVNGTDRTALILRDSWTLTTRADGTPATFTFQLKTITPAVGQDVKVTFATPNDYLFAGTLLQASAAPEAPDSPALVWNCVAVGYQWLLDRYNPVLAQYDSTGVGTIAADILYRFTDGGFRIGYCPSSLGNLTMPFTFEPVWTALQRLAKAANAVCELAPDRVVNIYPAGTYPEAALADVTGATILEQSLNYQEDLTQVRTRTLYQGLGTTAAALTPAGSATVRVNATSMFSTGGGSAISGRSLFTYTGLTVETVVGGPGTLTGCSGILYDIAANDPVDVIVDVTDGAATTALATLLGGGLSGQAINVLQDGRLSVSEATARATADLATFGSALEETGFTYKTPKRYVRAGRSVTLAVTTPLSIAGTFTIQVVTLKPYGIVSGSSFDVRQHVELGVFSRSLNDLLKQLPG